MVTTRLHDAGLRSSHLHLASLASIGLCITLWIRAKTVDQDERGNAERRALFERVRKVARRRRLLLLASGNLRADGDHGGRHPGFRTIVASDRAAVIAGYGAVTTLGASAAETLLSQADHSLLISE